MRRLHRRFYSHSVTDT